MTSRAYAVCPGGDVARMVLFLPSHDGAMCMAQSFGVDGGWAWPQGRGNDRTSPGVCVGQEQKWPDQHPADPPM
jgi:hypothetical protein